MHLTGSHPDTNLTGLKADYFISKRIKEFEKKIIYRICSSFKKNNHICEPVYMHVRLNHLVSTRAITATPSVVGLGTCK